MITYECNICGTKRSDKVMDELLVQVLRGEVTGYNVRLHVCGTRCHERLTRGIENLANPPRIAQADCA